MARADTQAAMNKKLDDIVLNLADAKEVYLLAAKHLDSKFREISNLPLQSGPHKTVPSMGADNQLGGDGRIPRKRTNSGK
jgi:hypothetical protein